MIRQTGPTTVRLVITLALGTPLATGPARANQPRAAVPAGVVETTADGSTRSPSLALGLSLGSTALLFGGSFALAAACDDPHVAAGLSTAGLVLGPSAGYVYTGDWSRVTWMSLGRLAAWGMMLVGAEEFTKQVFAESWTDHGTSVNDAKVAAFWVGSATLVFLAAWDIVDSPSAARRYNRSHRAERIVVAPRIFAPPPDVAAREPGYGIGFTGRF